MAQDRPKIAQDSSKEARDTPRRVLDRPKTRLRGPETGESESFWESREVQAEESGSLWDPRGVPGSVWESRGVSESRGASGSGVSGDRPQRVQDWPQRAQGRGVWESLGVQGNPASQ